MSVAFYCESSYAIAVLAVVILSIRLSITCVLGDTPFRVKFALKVTQPPPLRKTPT